MKSKKVTPRWNPEALQMELNHVRQLSLAAARQNDFRTVARLTSEASRLNHALRDLDNDSVVMGGLGLRLM